MRNEELIVAHMDLARQIAAKKQRSLALHVEHSDLESEAVFALMKAGSRFDESRGVPFRAFVRIRIAGALEDWCSYRSQAPFGELADDRSAKPHQEFRVLSKVLGLLPQREFQVIRLRFALGLTTYQAATHMRLSQSRIMQLQRRALATLREALVRRGVRKVADLV
jgi:RNA polymerase sigma factor (sigma-70 family)